MRVAVLLVNFNQWDLTRRCLESLEASEGVEVLPLLVDNCSIAPPPAWLSEHPGLRFRRLEKNAGFASGNNIAFEMAGPGEAEYTFLLNTDATVAPGTLSTLVRFLEENPSASIASPPVLLDSERDRVYSAGGRFIPWRMLMDQRFGASVAELPTEPEEADFVSGCALMVRSEVYRDLGGLPDGYFLYWEDAEFCLRAARHGHRTFLVPGTAVYHRVSSSSGGAGSPVSIYYPLRNRFLLARSVLPATTRMWFYIYATAVVTIKSILFPLRGQPGKALLVWKAYFDGLTGSTGPRRITTRKPVRRPLTAL